MTTTIGIVGLGQIGSSIGLALKARGGPERLVGYDRDGGVVRHAVGIGAVHGAATLKGAVKDADLVFLCLPLSEMRETLRQIAPDLKENAIVLDTAPIKRQLNQWVQEWLPSGRHHLGLVPSLSPASLAINEVGIEAAHAELFHHTIMIVVTHPATPAPVQELGLNIVRLLGAKPMLTDPVESDGIMTTAHLLPQLTSAALIEACVEGGGWQEARKLAGRPFTSVTGGMAYFDDPKSVQAEALSDSARVVHALEVLIASLQGLRDDISNGDSEQVGERLAQSYRTRERWLDERISASWLREGHEPVKIPGLGEHLTQMFFGGRIADAARNLEEKRGSRK